MRTCSIDGCEKRHEAQGYCQMHYARVKKYGDPSRGRPPAPEWCAVDGCGRRHLAKGLCKYHYERKKERGDPCAPLLKGHEIHGESKSPEYQVWASMKDRCQNPNHPGFKNYGGRGIKVCQEWNASFLRFLRDMGRRPAPDLTIERKNNDGNYEPRNCVWATRLEQAHNRRCSPKNRREAA